MLTPHLPRRTSLQRWSLVFAAFAALLSLLAACGPGLGGTGTGPEVDPLTAFQASSAPVCNSELAASLQCPSAGAGAPSLAGTAVVGYADGSGNSQVLARFDGDRIEWQAPCQGQRFVGQWGQVSGQPPRFYGLSTQTGLAPVLASLHVQVVGERLQVLLLDSNNNPLAQARLLTRLAGAPPGGAATCA